MGYHQAEPIEYNQCQDAVRRLNDFLSHELRPDEEAQVQHHLSRCKGCLAKYHFEETLLRTIRERAQSVRTPDDLRARILSLLSNTDVASNSLHNNTETAPFHVSVRQE